MSWSDHDLVEALAGRLVARAELHEPEVTALVRDVIDAIGGQLVGVIHRVKTVESLTRKLAEMSRQDPTLSVEEVGNEIYDVLRYTVVSEDAWYIDVHDRVLAGLGRQGIHLVEDRNRWEGPGYRGFNVRFRVEGQRFEVQFHTPASYEAAKATRAYYEEFRLAETPLARKAELHALIDAIFAPVPVPPGVLS